MDLPIFIGKIPPIFTVEVLDLNGILQKIAENMVKLLEEKIILRIKAINS